VSKDFVNWSPPRRIFVPDERDRGMAEFYGFRGAVARGSLLIGMLRVLRDDLPCDRDGPRNGIGYTVLARSRDGENWQRDREPFLDRNHTPGTWDHAMAWADSQVLIANHLLVYYGGYAGGHKVERFMERQIGLARLLKDRYVAWEARGIRGALRTRLLLANASGLTVNADVRGELRVRVLNERGQPVRGFDWKDCRAIKGDSVSHLGSRVRPLSALRGRCVRLEFRIWNGRLYAFGPAGKRS